MNGRVPVPIQTPRDAAINCSLNSQQHARKRRWERGISEFEIRETIRVGTLRWIGREQKWESENRYQKIMYRVKPCNIFLITVMYQRAR